MKRWVILSAMLAVVMAGGAVYSQAADVIINEVVYDSEGADTNTWLELKGIPGMSLDGYTVVGVNGNGGADYQIIALDGYSIPSDGYFVIAQDAAFPEADMIDTNVNYQNSPDNIQIRYDGGVVDALGYGTFGGSDIFAGEGSPAEDQVPPYSLARCPDGVDTDDNSVDFALTETHTPGAENVCGGGGDDPTPYTLCDLTVNDANGVPVHIDEYVITQGVCIAASGTWSPTTQEFQITDDGCCITVFGGALDPMVEIGDLVEVIGTIEIYNGKSEIAGDLEVTILSSGNPIPDPLVITTGELAMNGEAYESCLIQVNCLTIVGGDPWPAEGSNANVNVDDGSGVTVLRVDKDTDIDGSPEPIGPFTVIGIGGQFDSSSPYTEGYQLFPRSLEDLVFDCGAVEGACCIGEDCYILIEDDCINQGGEFVGGSCDPNPCVGIEPTPYTLCELSEVDADGVAVHLGEWVVVQGVALSDINVFGGTNAEYQISDGNCCVTIFEYGNLNPFVLQGDLVEVIGTVDQYNGKIEVTTPDMTTTVLSSGNPLPDPTVVTTGELAMNGEAYESCLIEIACVDIVDGTWPAEGQNANITIDDGTGPVTLRIDRDTDVDGSPEPTEAFTVVGVGGQFDNSVPLLEGYQILPRSVQDLIFNCTPVTGACCLISGECLILTQEECVAIEDAEYYGDDLPCDPNPCPPPVPTIESTWGTIKNQFIQDR